MTTVTDDDPDPFRPTLADKWTLALVDVAPVNAVRDAELDLDPLVFLRITAHGPDGETDAKDLALDLPNAATLLVALTDGAHRAFGTAALADACDRIRAAYLPGT